MVFTGLIQGLTATLKSIKGYTTVATMLTKMERNGQVAHRTEGRVHVYRPALHRERVSQSMVADLAGRLFDGDVAKFISSAIFLADSRKM